MDFNLFNEIPQRFFDYADKRKHLTLVQSLQAQVSDMAEMYGIEFSSAELSAVDVSDVIAIDEHDIEGFVYDVVENGCECTGKTAIYMQPDVGLFLRDKLLSGEFELICYYSNRLKLHFYAFIETYQIKDALKNACLRKQTETIKETAKEMEAA